MFSPLWLILPGAITLAVIVIQLPRWRQQHAIRRLAQARHLFHLRREWLEGVGCVGITAGASTPDALMDEVEDFVSNYVNETSSRQLS